MKMGGANGLIVHAPSSQRGNTQVQVDMGGLIVSAKLNDLRRSPHSHRTKQHALLKKKKRKTVTNGSPFALPSSVKSRPGSHALFAALSPLLTCHSWCSHDTTRYNQVLRQLPRSMLSVFVYVTHANTRYEERLITEPAGDKAYEQRKTISMLLQSMLGLESKSVLTRLMSEGSEQIQPSCMWSRSCQRKRLQE